ncbi:histidine decarboxylase, pyruvoyl type [Actinokineospora enzanensis]|uniref:histidine decarboxylase, pyruvoyl type n=1 Tax=Actinokineospora enzanensis TaxID=155975 RepID=UPI0003691111|nr:histidine decarboxylase, pyruvoyl type [Actinokineospora enzanensis]
MTAPTLGEVIDNAVGSYTDYATGYGNPPHGMDATRFTSDGSGYIATMKLSVATVDMAGLDWGTESIVSHDRCETADANIGQINMGTAASFCGPGGALWGLHLAKADLGAHRNTLDLYTADELDALTATDREPSGLAWASAGPLLVATERLFGHAADDRRTPPLPGSHVVCGNKSATIQGPAYAWALLAVAVPEDPTIAAHLFIGDCGTITPYDRRALPTAEQVRRQLVQHRDNVLKSIELCGQDYDHVTYKAAYVAGKAILAKDDQVACALACAPYIQLPQRAIPADIRPRDLADLSITEWERRVWGERPFPASPTGEDGIHVRSAG